MIDFVVDANILMSMLISGKLLYRPLLTYYRFYAPEFVFVEIEKYSSVILRKSKLDEEELKLWTYFVFSQIRTMPKYVLTQEYLSKTNQLLENVDLKDTSYVALSMQMDLVLLTRDDILFSGLRKQGYCKTMKFDDFLRNI